MLDTLHEDLNRVKKKPYVEIVELEGVPDSVAAANRWQLHLLRNQSIVVDLMHGQLKSTLKCPNCHRISITYDPYMTVPLPIPHSTVLEFFFVPYSP